MSVHRRADLGDLHDGGDNSAGMRVVTELAQRDPLPRPEEELEVEQGDIRNAFPRFTRLENLAIARTLPFPMGICRLGPTSVVLR